MIVHLTSAVLWLYATIHSVGSSASVLTDMKAMDSTARVSSSLFLVRGEATVLAIVLGGKASDEGLYLVGANTQYIGEWEIKFLHVWNIPFFIGWCVTWLLVITQSEDGAMLSFVDS